MLFGRRINKWNPNFKKKLLQLALTSVLKGGAPPAHASCQVKESGLQGMPGYMRGVAEIRLHLGELQQRTWGKPFFATVHGQEDKHMSHSIEPMPGYTLPEMPG